jgi:methyl-accepting chemotaxis protein
MKILYKGSLQRTMIIYFLMISFASLLIAAEFIYDIHGGAMQPRAAARLLQTLGDKAVIMVVLFLLVVLILLTMFIKNITEPLQHMIETSKLVSAGDLSRTVTIRAKNELAELGGVVNGLTSNLQEMILLSSAMCARIEEFETVLNSPENDRQKVEILRDRLNLLRSDAGLINDIVKNCKFYGIGR